MLPSVLSLGSWLTSTGINVADNLKLELNINSTYVIEPSSQYIPLTIQQEILGLNVSITRTSANSQILVYCAWSGENGGQAWDIAFGLNRNGSPIGNPAGGYGMTTSGSSYFNNDSSTPEVASFWYLDSPASTAALTYTMTCAHTSSSTTLYTNRTVTLSTLAYYELLTSNMIALEVLV